MNSYYQLLEKGILLKHKVIDNFTMLSGEVKTLKDISYKNGNIRKSFINKIKYVNYTGDDTRIQVTTRDKGGWTYVEPFSIKIK